MTLTKTKSKLVSLNLMGFQRDMLCVVGVLLVMSVTLGSAGDIVHQDDVTPSKKGCDNNFVLVRLLFFLSKIKNKK